MTTLAEPMTEESLESLSQEEYLSQEEQQLDDEASNTSSAAEEETPTPKYKPYQRVLAKDNSTPLLYEAVVRKLVYAPKSKKINVCLLESADESIISDDFFLNQEPIYQWHYFVHYQGWNVKWDRWVDEDQLYEDTPDARILAKRLKEESKCLKKKGNSQKKVIEVMQRIVRLEQELREKQARGESIEDYQTSEDRMKIAQEAMEKEKDSKQKENPNDKAAKSFVQKEMHLKKRDLTSRKSSMNLPFILKKVLIEDWEVVSQCNMLHVLPSSITVMDALNAFYQSKENMYRNDNEEKKSDEGSSENVVEGQEQNVQNEGLQEWKTMIDGVSIFFDQALQKRILYRQEIPQCMLLEQNYEKRYCELYPCEHLIRMCIKLNESLEDAKHITEEEKSIILFQLGDLLRFLSKNHDTYFLSRYRKATEEEASKANKLKKRLGLEEQDNEDMDTMSDNDEAEVGDKSAKKKGTRAGGKKKNTKEETVEELEVDTQIASSATKPERKGRKRKSPVTVEVNEKRGKKTRK